MEINGGDIPKMLKQQTELLQCCLCTIPYYNHRMQAMALLAIPHHSTLACHSIPLTHYLSLQVHEDDVQYSCNLIESPYALKRAVMDDQYPPKLTFRIIYDTHLAFSNAGEHKFVHLYIDGTSKGRLTFPTSVYRRRRGEDDMCMSGLSAYLSCFNLMVDCVESCVAR